MYQILLTPNAFKGCMDAPLICKILQEELNGENRRIISMPLGDGGDGTAAILASYLKAQPLITQAKDALGRKHEVVYYTTEDTAIIELAAICGLKFLQPNEYDILNANTTGVGEVICKAVKQGYKKIILCIGGSASIDGGTGALMEMGLKIVNTTKKYHNHIIDIESIKADKLKERFNDISFTILCDVNNPLAGRLGAARIFGKQKGADDLQVSLLDSQLSVFAQILKATTRKNMTTVKHGGAAGGIAAAFAALLNARLVSGSEYCIELSGFKNEVDKSNLVITGEGKIDRQSLSGKIPGAIATICNEHQTDIIAIAGIIEDNIRIFKQTFILSQYAGSVEASLLHPEQYLRMAAQEIKKRYLDS